MNSVFRIQAMMTLSDFISGPLGAIRQSFRATGNDAEGLSGRIGTLAKRAAPFAVAAGLIVGGMTATALATAETSKALGELGTLGAQDLELFRAQAMEVSNEWAGISAPGFISAAYDVKSALSDLSEQAQADITELAAVTSVATKASVEDMTSFIGKAYNIMGKSADFEGLSDTQVAEQLFAGMSSTVKEFMTTGPAMRQSLMSMGNAATLAGIGISDQLAALGRLNNVMEASVAGTGFKTFSNKLPEVAQKLGLNFRDAAGEMLPLPDILDMITESVGGLESDASQMKTNALFGIEAATAFKNLAEASEELRGKTATVGSAMSTGREYILEMAKAANDHLGANIQKSSQQISNLIEIIGSMFVPIVNTAVQFISWLALGFQRIVSVIAGNPLLKWVVQMTALTGLLASLVGLFGAFSAMLPGIIALVGGYASAMWTAATASLSVTWPIYAVVAAIGLLVLAFKTNFLGIGDTLREWFGTVRLVFEGVRGVFASLRGDTYTITGDLAEKLKANGLVGIVEGVAGGLFRFWQILRGIGDVAVTVAKIGLTVLAPVWKVLASVIGMVVSGVRNLMNAVTTIISPIIQLVGLIDPNVWRVLGVVIGTAVVVPLVALLAHLAPVIAAFGLVVGAVWTVAKAFQGLMMLFDLVVRTVFDGWNRLVTFDWGALAGMIGGGIRSMIQSLGSLSLFDVGRKLWQSFADGIKSMITAPLEVVKSGLQKVRDLLPFSDAKEGPLSTLTLSGSRLLATFADGVDRAAPALRKSVGVALTGLMPMTAGADVIAPEPPLIERTVITAPSPEVVVDAPEISQATPEIMATQTVKAPSPEITPAGPVAVSAAAVETAPPDTVQPQPVEVTAPAVSVAEATPVELVAPEVTQAAPVAPDAQSVQVAAAEVSVDAPVIDQATPEVTPAGLVAMPAAAVEIAPPGTVKPDPVEVASPAVIQEDNSDTPVFRASQLPEPVARETIREKTVESVRHETTNTGTTRYYTIQNMTLNLPNVTDARTFADEIATVLDAHDGGN